MPPSQPGQGWTWREGEVRCWEALPGASCPAVPGSSCAKFKLLAVPSQALQPSWPLLLPSLSPSSSPDNAGNNSGGSRLRARA